MNPIVIELTPAQDAELEPFMEELRAIAASKKPGILCAQVFPGHMRVGIISNEEGMKVAKSATTIQMAPELLEERADETSRLMEPIWPNAKRESDR